MKDDILKHYLEFSIYTDPGLYKNYLIKKLPDNIKEIGQLVRKQIIHRLTLKDGNTGSNADLRYGDMTKVPWYQQCQDDVLSTTSAILSEFFRRDKRGFVKDRKEKDKLILTCRFVAILMASILKSKGISTRVRSGFAPYFFKGKSVDHWINQYWNKNEKKWINIDIDGCFQDLEFDPFDIPKSIFDFSADVWLNIRKKKISEKRFWNAGGYDGLVAVAWELFYDFHSLMNNEIIYSYHPNFILLKNFKDLKEKQLKEVDELALLMRNPDENFYKLKKIWKTKRKWRLLKGGLL